MWAIICLMAATGQSIAKRLAPSPTAAWLQAGQSGTNWDRFYGVGERSGRSGIQLGDNSGRLFIQQPGFIGNGQKADTGFQPASPAFNIRCKGPDT